MTTLRHKAPAWALGLMTLLIAAPAMADDDPKHKLKSGDKTLLFNISSVFASAPESFDNIGIGGRYVLSKELAIRAGLGFDLIDRTVEVSDGNTTVSRTGETSTFGLEAGAEYYLFQNGPAGLYVGGILQLASSSTDPNDDGEDTVDTLALTLAGVLGANYFILDYLTLGAEYRLGVSYISTEVTPGQGNGSLTDSTTRIGVGSFGFHLGVWFD